MALSHCEPRASPQIGNFSSFGSSQASRFDTREAHHGSEASQPGTSQTAFDLKAIAGQGCAVVVTALARHAELLAPAVTVIAELSATALVKGAIPEALLALGARNVELIVRRNRLGATGSISLRLVPGLGLAEERARTE